MRRSPRVTVFCPIYNDAAICAESVQSVLDQKDVDFKLILLDNGSTDRSREVINDFSDKRITVIHSQSNLKSETMAKLMWGADTEFISQIYSDDIFEPNKLSLSLKAMDDSRADVCFSNNLFINDKGELLADEQVPPSQFLGDISLMSADNHLYRCFKYGNSLHPVSMVISADAYRKIGGVRPYLHSIGDMELFARVLLKTKPIFLQDKLQKIRIKSIGRNNESAPSMATYLRIVGERMRFYDALNSPECLSRIGDIFYPKQKGLKIPDALSKWFLGQQIVKLGDPDCKFVGMKLLYEALDGHFTEIESYLVPSCGMTVGQYMESISSTIFASGLDFASAHEIERLNDLLRDLQKKFELAERDFVDQKNRGDQFEQELTIVRQELGLAQHDFGNQKNRGDDLELKLATVRQELGIVQGELAVQLSETRRL